MIIANSNHFDLGILTHDHTNPKVLRSHYGQDLDDYARWALDFLTIPC